MPLDASPGNEAEIGVFGGSGFYSLLEEARELWVETPYGATSDRITLGEIAGRKVAFLPRHGRDHRYPPHMVNYRANVWAMRRLGVTRIIGPTACGSLKPSIKPGDFVIADQIVDRTRGRKDTFYDGPIVTHVGFADPYCAQMRPIAVTALRALGITVHDGGTIVTIQGPRFSTRAESRWFSSAGWEVINMTQYPECYLARELEMCYVNISLITDFDVGLEDHPGIEPVSHEEVMRVFASNVDRVRGGIFKIVEATPRDRTCACGSALAGARF
jgi:5'-methylthioadenosine phosphorylase